MKLIQLSLLSLLTILALSSYAQGSKISWEKHSQVRGTDFFTDVIEDANAGYTVVGSKNIKGNSLDY